MKILILFLSIVYFIPAAANAQQNPCAKYFGKGYCTDYIERRTGKRQRGNAGTWSSNIQKKDVRAGDVAIFTSPGVGHVAVVEKVIYEHGTDRPYQVEISEWNWGTMKDPACSVTDHFGRTRSRNRVVLVSSVARFWRP